MANPANPACPTKERLLDAAWSCVCEGGIATATSRAISTEAGANLAAITYYFGSKEQLLAEAFVAAIRRLIAPALDALQQHEVDPVTRTLQAIERLQQSLADSAQLAPAYLEILIHSRRIPSMREQVGDLFSELRALLSVQMTEQQANGYLPAWVEPQAMAALLLSMAQGVVLQTTIDPDGPAQTAIADQFAQLLIAGR